MLVLVAFVLAIAVGQTTTPPVTLSFPRSFYMELVGGVQGNKINVSVTSDDASQSLKVHEEIRSAAGLMVVTALVHGGANKSCSVQFGRQCSLVCLDGEACPLVPESCASCQFGDLLSQFGHEPSGPCSFQLQRGTLFNATVVNAVQSFNTSLCFDTVHGRPIFVSGTGGQASFFLLVAAWDGGGSRFIEPVGGNCTCPGAARPAPRSLFLELATRHRRAL